jgi:hypothetical protein
LALFVSYYRDVFVVRGGQAQEFLQVHLAGRGIDQVVASYDVGYALEGVIDYYRQLVGINSV